MLNEFLQMLMGGGGQAPATPTPAVNPMPQPAPMPAQGPMPMQGPPMPAYMQDLSPVPSAKPGMGQDLRQQLIMKMMQQGMMGQGQGQPQAPQAPPMSMAPGRASMPTGGVSSATAGLSQRMQPNMMSSMMPRRPLGMGY